MNPIIGYQTSPGCEPPSCCGKGQGGESARRRTWEVTSRPVTWGKDCDSPENNHGLLYPCHLINILINPQTEAQLTTNNDYLYVCSQGEKRPNYRDQHPHNRNELLCSANAQLLVSNDPPRQMAWILS